MAHWQRGRGEREQAGRRGTPQGRGHALGTGQRQSPAGATQRGLQRPLGRDLGGHQHHPPAASAPLPLIPAPVPRRLLHHQPQLLSVAASLHLPPIRGGGMPYPCLQNFDAHPLARWPLPSARQPGILSSGLDPTRSPCLHCMRRWRARWLVKRLRSKRELYSEWVNTPPCLPSRVSRVRIPSPAPTLDFPGFPPPRHCVVTLPSSLRMLVTPASYP